MPDQGARAVAVEEVFDRAVALHEQGRLEPAEQLYRAILNDRGGSCRRSTQSKDTVLQRGDYDGAVAFTHEFVRQRPDIPTADNTLAVALKHLRRFAEAEACCREALRLAPEYAEAHNNLGTVLLSLARLDEVENLLSPRRHAQLHPSVDRFFARRRLCHWADYSPDEARVLRRTGAPADGHRSGCWRYCALPLSCGLMVDIWD